MRLRAAAALALVLLAAACHAPQAPGSASSPAPGISATPAPAESASPGAVVAPLAYHYVVTPPSPAPGQPAILEIDMLDQTIHVGAPYSVRVKTSPDVTGINVSSMGTTYGMQAAGPGLFASDGKVPGDIPFFLLNRSYGVTISAQTADGRSTAYTLSLRLER